MTDYRFSSSSQPPSQSSQKSSFSLFFMGLIVILGLNGIHQILKEKTLDFTSTNTFEPIPLVMEGGDPHIRALMRTISASESNVAKPYHVLYGGKYVKDLSKHPEKCMPIMVGVNTGNCSTAAGRYQMLNVTWAEKAQQYHPQPSRFLRWKSYSFEAQYQDQVVYHWLKDSQAWGIDISQQLQQGNIHTVLRHLSGTWTSLGYGIETNSMSSHLPQIYQKMLREELNQAPLSLKS